MNSEFESDSKFIEKMLNEIRAKDLVELKTIYQDKASYLVLQVLKNKLSIRALPINLLSASKDSDVIVPTLDIPFYMIKDYKKIDKSSLLFLINQDNPHIVKALKDFIKL